MKKFFSSNELIFPLKAFYRLCIIVYPQYKLLQSIWLYVTLPNIQLILSFIVFCPILIWNGIVYNPEEHNCSIEFSHLRNYLWMSLNCYCVPVLMLSLIYIRIIRCLHNQSNIRSHVIQRRQKRSLQVIRRILINLILLVGFGIPGIVLLIIRLATGTKYPLATRIVRMFSVLSITLLSISFIFVITQLKNIVFTKWKHNRVRCLENITADTNQMRINKKTMKRFGYSDV